MGSVSKLLTFKSKKEMVNQLKDDKLKVWFADLIPWCSSTMKREATVWVMLKEVPLHVWHEKFFALLGNSLGSFVRLDNKTKHKKRLDITILLVSVESRLRIHSSVNVNVRGIDFKILITVEETETMAGECPIYDEVMRSEEKDVLVGKIFDGELNAVAYFRENGVIISSHEFDICPWLEQEYDGCKWGILQCCRRKRLLVDVLR
ncbi:hypothetical protein CRYUN_Cryun31cG0093900 [Craigia yunnanensis]